MKNSRTPRTLSDASFDVGYAEATPSKHGRRINWTTWSGWIAFAVLFLLQLIAKG